MNTRLFVIIAIFLVVAIAGVFVRNVVVRVLLWLLATPPFLLGLLALVQGGIAEPFTKLGMLAWCSVTMCPAAGCGLGEVLLHPSRKRNCSSNMGQNEPANPSPSADAPRG